MEPGGRIEVAGTRDRENPNWVAAYSLDRDYSWLHVGLSVCYQGPLIIVAGIGTFRRDGVTDYLLSAYRNLLRHNAHCDHRQLVRESKSLRHREGKSWPPKKRRKMRSF